MRDEQRIERICHNLERLWKQYPDMRLGQLLENYVFPNIVAYDYKGKLIGNGTYGFFQEDDETDKRIIMEIDFQHPAINTKQKTECKK